MSKLGIGLSELLNENLIFDGKEQIIEIELKQLHPNPYQPRKFFKPEAIRELTDSIKQFGVLQPIIAKKKGDKYFIVAGERRYRASIEAGLKTIPAIIRDYTENVMAEVAVLENLQRENLNAIEEAEAYRKMISMYNLTQEELAHKIGKSRSYVTNTIGLLKLPKNIQKLIAEEGMSMSHARVLSKIDDKKVIDELANLVVNNNISVREIELLSKELKDSPKKEVKATHKRNQRKLEKVIGSSLFCKSKVTDNKIIISYKDPRVLKELIRVLDSKE